MARDDNVLKGRHAERLAQGIRDYLATLMNVSKEDLDVTYSSNTEEDETFAEFCIRGKKTVFKNIKARLWFTH